MTGREDVLRRRWSSSMPSIRGILMSSTARSTGRWLSALSAASPSE